MLQERITGPATIPAERIVLRPLRLSDSGLIAHYTGDRRLAEGTRHIPHPLPPGAAEAFVARAIAGENRTDTWAMDGTASGLAEVLGVVTLTHIDREQSEIAFWVAPGLWNAGFASEAVAALLAANPHRARTIMAEVFQDNPGPARVLTNSGFDYLGDAEAYSVARGRTVPTWTYLRRMA